MKLTKAKLGSTRAKKTRGQELGRSTTALLATAAATLAASGSAFALVQEFTVPGFDFSSTFPGHASVVGETYEGQVEDPFDVDFFSYTGLNPGDAFDLGLSFRFDDFEGASVFAQQATGTNTFIGSILTDSTQDGVFEHLMGVVPASGALSFRVSTNGDFDSEGYHLRLTGPGPRAAVPEPATVALLAAGLAGALLTRRRRRK